VSDSIRQRVIGLTIVALSSAPAAAQCVPTVPQSAQAKNFAICTCRIGPVTIDVPVCEIKTVSDDKRVDYIDWINDDRIMRHVIVITPKRPHRFKGYLAEWLHHHKCTGEEIRVGGASRFDTTTEPAEIPAQVTWTGSCAGGDHYIARAIGVGHQIVELHLDVGLQSKVANHTAEQTFADLVSQVRLTRPAEKRGLRSRP